jgi:hypothetical protein
MKFIKIASVAAAVVIAAALSAHFTKNYVAEVSSREKSLAEVIMGNAAAQELEAEAARAEQALGTTVTAVTTVTTTATTTTTAPITTTTPAPVTTTEAIPVAVTVTDVPVTTTSAPAPSITTDYQIGGLINTSTPAPSFKTIITLTADEQAKLTRYLIDHYFLDGFVFAAAETDPELKERKHAAAEMESAAVQTVNMVLSSLDLSNPTDLLNLDYDSIIKKVSDIKSGFDANYGSKNFDDPALKALYDGSILYFDNLSASLGRIKTAADNYKSSTNPIFAAGLALSAVTNTLLPEAMAVLESSFALVEASQPIFLENTTGYQLLTRDEVKEILKNPGYIL